MLPRALLFSSDPQVTELILALLPEFGVEVEHCRDVFGAIERLTSRSYQVIVVDWKEALEASFLLKTTRELSVAKATPAVAVVDEKEVSGALHAGASAVLIKPLSFEQARRTFLAALPNLCAGQPATAQDVTRQVPSPTVPAVPASSVPITRKPNGPAVAKRSSRTPIPKPPTFAGYAQEPRRSSKHRTKAFGFGLVALLLAGLLLGIGVRLRSQIVEAFRVSRFALHLPQRQTQPSDKDTTVVAAIDEPDFDATIAQLETRARLSRTRPLEVYPSAAPVRRPGTVAAQPAGTPVISSSEAELKVVRPEIPASLMMPVQAMATHAPETRLSSSPANKWSVEPILLPENISRELLVRQVVPRYPELAVVAGVEGKVLLHALVAKDGSIQELKLISGPLVLGRAAFESVKQWRYRPYRLNGQIVEMQTFVTVNFLRNPSTAMAQK